MVTTRVGQIPIVRRERGGMTARRLTLTCLFVAVFALPARGAFAICTNDSTTSDFSGSGTCYISDVAGGEVVLPATIATEFDGNALPAGWTAHEWSSAAVCRSARGRDGGRLQYLSRRQLRLRAVARIRRHLRGGLDHAAARADVPDDRLREWQPAVQRPAAARDRHVRPEQRLGGQRQRADVDTGNGNVIPLHQVDGLPHRYRIDWSANTVSYPWTASRSRPNRTRWAPPRWGRASATSRRAIRWSSTGSA